MPEQPFKLRRGSSYRKSSYRESTVLCIYYTENKTCLLLKYSINENFLKKTESSEKIIILNTFFQAQLKTWRSQSWGGHSLYWKNITLMLKAIFKYSKHPTSFLSIRSPMGQRFGFHALSLKMSIGKKKTRHV